MIVRILLLSLLCAPAFGQLVPTNPPQTMPGNVTNNPAPDTRLTAAQIDQFLGVTPSILQPNSILGNALASPSGGQSIPLGSYLSIAGGSLSVTCFNVSEQSVSSYTILSTDNCNTVSMMNPFGTAGVMVPSSNALSVPFKFTLVNQNPSYPLNVTTTGSFIYAGAHVSSLWMLSNTSCDFISDGTNWETSACSPGSNPTGVGNPLTVSGTNADTVYKYAFNTFNSAVGSPNISFGTNISGSFANSTIVVSGCGTLVATAPITVTNGGTGYQNGDFVTMQGGVATTPLVLEVIWSVGGVIQAVGATNSYPGVAVYGQGGAFTTFPAGGAFTQASTTGTGSGLAVTMFQSALPLATTIASTFTGGTTIPLNANCSQSFINGTQFVAWGHDDQPGITAQQAAGFTTVVLPANHTYGIREPIVMPTSYPPQTLNCQGSTIVALAPMNEMIETPTNGSMFQTSAFGPQIINCIFEGMGVASLNSLQGGDWMTYSHVGMRDATQANLEVNVVGGGGSIAINSTFDLQINNSPVLVPNYPIFCVWLANSHATDNQFLPGEKWNGCQQAGVYDQTFSTFYQGIHIYGVYNGPSFLLQGGAYNLSNLYADNPEGSYCGFQIAGSQNHLTGWQVLISGSFNVMNQGGVCLNAGQSVVTGGVWNATNLPAANGCQVPATGSGNYNNIFSDNIGCSFSNPGTPLIFTFNTGSALTGSGTTQYCPLGAGACATSSGVSWITVPIGGLIQGLYVNSEGDAGVGNSYTITLSSSTGSPTVTCTLSGAGSGNDSCNDITDSFQVAAGQSIQLKMAPSASAAGLRLYGGLKMSAYH